MKNSLAGALTLQTVPRQLHDADALATATDIDLREVTRIDSAALAFLLELTRRASVQGRALKFVNAPAKLRSLATFFQLDGVLSLGAQA